jgi:thiol-disulfide isomerase/thioredoxin
MTFRPSLLLLLFAVSALVAGAAPGPPPPAPTSDPVQIELNALKALVGSRPPGPLSPRENYLWFDGLTRQVTTAAFAFIEKHPADPRRWEAALILQMRRFQPRFVISIDEKYDGKDESMVKRDTAAETAFEARVAALEKVMRAAPDVPDHVMEQVAFGDLMPLYYPAFAAMRENRVPDISKIEPAVRAFLARFPDSETGRGMLPMFVQVATRQAEPKTEVEVLQTFADSPNHSAQAYVKDRLRFFELQKAPFELAFTALDGREVDLKKLRGKVVLIDFWATWCGPCIAELPNVKKVYADYHDKGFEIVSVHRPGQERGHDLAPALRGQGLEGFAGEDLHDLGHSRDVPARPERHAGLDQRPRRKARLRGQAAPEAVSARRSVIGWRLLVIRPDRPLITFIQ